MNDSTAPDPEGQEVQEVQEVDVPTPGAPTPEELAADENLYPTPNVGDDAGVDENGDDLHGES